MLPVAVCMFQKRRGRNEIWERYVDKSLEGKTHPLRKQGKGQRKPPDILHVTHFLAELIVCGVWLYVVP